MIKRPPPGMFRCLMWRASDGWTTFILYQVALFNMFISRRDDHPRHHTRGFWFEATAKKEA